LDEHQRYWVRVTISLEMREDGRNGNARLDVAGASIRADAAFARGDDQ
jgi:hypothetical protein